MTTFIILVAILQSFAISMGVGSSTLAILNFFTAIADGKIEDTERRMMGIVYVVLRIAMVAILLTTMMLLSYQYGNVGLQSMTAFSFGQLTALLILFVNAILMTAHMMPSTFGPAIQAGSWYTLGTLAALFSVGITDFTYIQFMLGYITWLVLTISIVNGVMAIMKSKKAQAS